MDLVRIKFLGQGAYGVVSLMEDRKTGHLYVYKESEKDLSKEKIALVAVKPECNPYLSCIVEANDEDGKVAGIVTEYIPNTFELESYLQKNFKTLNFYSRFVIMIRLLEGLVQIHKLGVVHRDIKPENILLEPNTLEVRYIDFGLACTKKDLECQRNLSGTPLFVSPELANALLTNTFLPWSLMKKTDVWALGITFLDLCFFDESPYFYPDTATNLELLREIAKIKPQYRLYDLIFPDKIIRGRPNPVSLFYVKVISLMLERNPEKRPTAKGMLQIMREHMTEELLEIAQTTSLKDIKERALAHAERVEVSPETKIFPGRQTVGEKKGLGAIRELRLTR